MTIIIRAKDRQPLWRRRLLEAYRRWQESLHANPHEPAPAGFSRLFTPTSPLSKYMHLSQTFGGPTLCGASVGDRRWLHSPLAWRIIKPGKECPRCIKASGIGAPWWP